MKAAALLALLGMAGAQSIPLFIVTNSAGRWLAMRPQDAPEGARRILLYPGMVSALEDAAAGALAASNALEKEAAAREKEAAARKAAERETDAWRDRARKEAAAARTLGWAQGAAVAGLAAIGAWIGAEVGKGPAGAAVGALGGAGVGVGISFWIGAGPPRPPAIR